MFIDPVCEVLIYFHLSDLCNILLANHVSRMKEWNIFQKIIETSHTGSMYKR